MPGKAKHGGSRPGAGRKPKAASPPTLDDLDAARALLESLSVEDLMEMAVGMAAKKGHWDEVSKAGARLLNAKARRPAKDPAPVAPAASRFASRPPPKPN